MSFPSLCSRCGRAVRLTEQLRPPTKPELDKYAGLAVSMSIAKARCDSCQLDGLAVEVK